MKKGKKEKGSRIAEIVSLNEELFSLVTGDPMAALDQRLALAVGGVLTCDTFTCGSFSGSCGAFACGSFKNKPV
jgi:hypothetical protein